MRTTLDIDDDVLQTAKELAAKQKRSAGAVISELARRGFQAAPVTRNTEIRTRNGIPLLPSRGEQVTLSHVRQILEEEGI
ncbi:MAG: hypothetical protein ABI600_11600 [Luteolibacter sp.]